MDFVTTGLVDGDNASDNCCNFYQNADMDSTEIIPVICVKFVENGGKIEKTS